MSAEAFIPAAGRRVAVVGLGPVGGVLALLLRAHGVDVLAVDRDPDPYPAPRAIAVDDEALRVLQAAGIDDLALRMAPVRLRGRDGSVLLELPPLPSPYGHPSLAFFVQPDLERLVRARLRAAQADVRLGHEVTAVAQERGGAVLTVRDRASGRTTSERVAWVAGCDGARSIVRRALGARLRGLSATRPWLVVDTLEPAAGGAADPAAFEFTGDPRRPWVHGPLPAGRHRFEFLLDGDGPADATAAARALLAERLPPPVPEVLRAAVYRFHARVATRWRGGRLVLAGDAAHLAPPFAGQGLSAGLRDAAALAWRLAAVAGGAAGSLLGSYERERRAHVVRTTGLALALGAGIQARARPVAAARDAALSALLGVPGLRAWSESGGWKPAARLPRRGSLVAPGALGRPPARELLPQPLLGAARLDDVLGPAAALVGARRDPASLLDAPAGAALRALGGVALAVPALAPWLDARGVEVVLVRPDRSVFAAGPGEHASAAVRAFAAAVGA